MVNAVFIPSNKFGDTVKQHPECVPLLKAFKDSKEENPIRQYGASDTSFSGSGNFQGLRHAHLTRDLALVYTLSGAHPRRFHLYGIYSHAELGTGTPPNPRKQKSAGTQLRNMTFI